MQFRLIGNKTTSDFNRACFDRINMMNRLEEYLKSYQIDAIVSPVFPIPAFKHGQFKKVGFGFFYCSIWNFYDYPGCTIPNIHKVKKEETEEYFDFKFGDDSVTKAARENLKGSEGLPIGVQV